jgi:hypothetical protein
MAARPFSLVVPEFSGPAPRCGPGYLFGTANGSDQQLLLNYGAHNITPSGWRQAPDRLET